MDDFELLQAYVTRGSEAAFAELVDRHVDLVYSAALRQLRDEHAAKDVTQLVFLRLAGKGRTLRRGTVIAGWLYHAVRWVAAEHRRAELRRHRREHLAAEHMNETDDSPDRDQLARVLDDGMAGLSEEERDALVLRFFENKSFRDVGAALGVSDDAAQKRVSRALERLRLSLADDNLRVSTAALAAVLPAVAVQAAPTGLAGTISAGVAAAAGTALLTTGGTTLMATTQLKAIIATGAALAAATALVIEHQRSQALEAEIGSLQESYEQARQRTLQASQRTRVVDQDLQATRAQIGEIHELRGKVTQLRQSQQDTAALAAQNEQLLNQLREAARDETPQPEPEMQLDEEEAVVAGQVNHLKTLGLAFHGFKAQTGAFPDRLSSATAFLPEGFAGRYGDAQLEITYHGPIEALSDAGATIMVREKQASTMRRGRPVKTYLFADGSVQVVEQPPEGFEAWERQRIVNWRPQ